MSESSEPVKNPPRPMAPPIPSDIRSALLSPITQGYLGEIGHLIFDDNSCDIAKKDIDYYYEKKTLIANEGSQDTAEWDGAPIDYAMFYYHRFFHDQGCFCPHDVGPGYDTSGKWAGDAYNYYDPADSRLLLTAPGGSSGASKAGQSSMIKAQDYLESAQRQWEKIQAFWAYNSIDSPFVPQTFDEYMEFKSENMKAKQISIINKIEDTASKKAAKKGYKTTYTHRGGFKGNTRGGTKRSARGGFDNSSNGPRMSEKLLEIHNRDNLSLVNCRISIWHENEYLFVPIDWPQRWEYEYYQGVLPLPRTQEVDELFEDDLVDKLQLFPAVGPDVPRQFRKIANRALHPVFDGMTKPEYDDMMRAEDVDVEQFEMEELTGFTQQLLEEIDKDEP
ncbi:hypothetical protein F5Y11DRAFT_367005 [Daldinia sp. FL1419]|nr:hypothetical protein F5Y11DRAFT_367005 [Daldinia sp. FL1419]